ncbi:PD-(D/E)XK nuclease family protein, partial [Thioclava sp. F28-4]|uniref:PDDEXK-like family protein n=1 Tax=Thioclava sp. F28-4 TaxID=1915315 RepID=UPI000998E2F1
MDKIAEKTAYFCPFEAVGMVRQEIRHSNFLSYVLDPARPHAFGDHVLKAALVSLLEDDDSDSPKRFWLDRDLRKAQVYRERHNIDILIELPPTGPQAGLLIALELKIDAKEGSQQLARYEEILTQRYTPERYDHIYGFITPDGRDPSTEGDGRWSPLSYSDLFERIEAMLPDKIEPKPRFGTSRSIALVKDYIRMMRRHGMAKGEVDQALDNAVKRLWAEHREALEYAIENRPYLLRDAVERFIDAGNMKETAKYLSERCKDAIKPDKSDMHWQRFEFAKLNREFPRLVNSESRWLPSHSLLALELTLDPTRRVWSFCIALSGDPAEKPEFRECLQKELSSASGERSTKRGYCHYFRKDLIADEDLSSVNAVLIFPKSAEVKFPTTAVAAISR